MVNASYRPFVRDHSDVPRGAVDTRPMVRLAQHSEVKNKTVELGLCRDMSVSIQSFWMVKLTVDVLLTER